MKADLSGLSTIDTIIGPRHGPKPIKKSKHAPSARSTEGYTTNFASIIERADKIVAKINQKLLEMSKLLDQIRDEKNDIIREQLARFFNVLRAYIEEALRPSGDWSTDQIMSGKNIKINIGSDGASMVVQGERIDFDKLGIREMSLTPTSKDLETLQHNIKKAQTNVKKLRDNLVSARHLMVHHSQESDGFTL